MKISKKILSMVLALTMVVGTFASTVAFAAENNAGSALQSAVKLDTGKSLTVQPGKTYQFKVTSATRPTFVCGTNSVFQVAENGFTGNDYFFKVTAVGKPGQSAGFYVNSEKTPRTIGTIASSEVTLDTGSQISVQEGTAYQFKLTSSVKPTFVCGTDSVFKITENGSNGNEYFFLATAIGKAGQSAGFYVNGEKSPRTVGTITSATGSVLPGSSGSGSSGSHSSTVHVSSVSVTPTTMTLVAGGSTGKIVATVSPSNASNKGIIWSSSNPAVATVANGVVTPLAAGTATMTATSASNSAKFAAAVVTVSTSTEVSSADELQAALNNPSVTAITLGANIEGDITVIRTGSTNFTVDFASFTLTGNLNITAADVTGITFVGSAVPAITGSLTVSAAKATVNNGINVGGTITVSDVGDHSWVENADGNTITVTDPNGASIVIQGKPEDITVGEDANGITITVHEGAVCGSITANSPITITVENGATVNSITASETAEGTKIINNGVIPAVNSDANIAIENNNSDSSINVGGSGVVTPSGTADGNIKVGPKPEISNAMLRSNEKPQLFVDFRISKEIDLTKPASDVIISYQLKDDNGEYKEVYRKDKAWSGYLNTYPGEPSQGGVETKYGPGAENNQNYLAILPKDKTISTSVSQLDWQADGYLSKLRVVITVKDNCGTSIAEDVIVSSSNDLKEVIQNAQPETTILVNGTIGGPDSYTAYEITKPVTIIGMPEAAIYGSFEIKTNDVTVKGLKMFTRGGGNGPLKAAIDVIAKNVTITDNTFELPNPDDLAANGGVGNGVTIWPHGDGDINYNIAGNTFKGYKADTPDWSSTALQIAEGLDLDRFNMKGTVSEAVDLGDAEKDLATGNIYTDCTNNYVHSNWEDGMEYKYVLASTSDQLSSLEYAGDGATILVSGTIGGPNSYTAYEITKPITILGLPDAEVYGSFEIKTDGVTVNGLKMYTRGGGNGPLKAAIDVIAKNVTITNNTFELPDPDDLADNGGVGNGVTIWPLGDGDINYNIVDNTFNGYNADTPNWSSTALQIAEGLDLARFNKKGMVSEVVDLGDAEKDLAMGNNYNNCSNNYVHSNWADGVKYKYVLASTLDQLNSLEYAEDGATILIGDNISDIDSRIVVDKAITIDGNGYQLAFTDELNELDDGYRQGILVIADNVTIEGLNVQMAGGDGWQGVYGYQVYDAYGVVLQDVSASGADGGILVNGSKVTLKGEINVSDNEFGGIEVSKGTNTALNNSELTVDATLTNDTEAYGKPTIWVVNGQGIVSGVDGYTENTTVAEDQTQYYLDKAKAVLPAGVVAINNAGSAGETQVAMISHAEDLFLNVEGDYATLTKDQKLEVAKAVWNGGKDYNRPEEIKNVFDTECSVLLLENCQDTAENKLNELVVTNDTDADEILNALTDAIGNTDVSVEWSAENGFTKEEATADEEGSITGTIVLGKVGVDSLEVDVNLVIDQLASEQITEVLEAA